MKISNILTSIYCYYTIITVYKLYTITTMYIIL